MKETDLDTTDPRLLAGLIESITQEAADWSHEDLAAILRHQLRMPLRSWLKNLKPEVAEKLGDRGTFPPAETFADSLGDPKPSLDILDAVKRSAKALLRDAKAALPHDVAMAIYTASIALARARCGTSITKMNDRQLTIDIHSALRKEWMDPSIKAVLQECLATMASQH